MFVGELTDSGMMMPRPAMKSGRFRAPVRQMAAQESPAAATDDLIRIVVAAFRRHPHISNIMAHLSGQDWLQVEKALELVLNPATTCARLSPLARDIVDLICTNREAIRRILGVYFPVHPTAAQDADPVEGLIGHCDRVFFNRAFIGRSAPFSVCVFVPEAPDRDRNRRDRPDRPHAIHQAADRGPEPTGETGRIHHAEQFL